MKWIFTLLLLNSFLLAEAQNGFINAYDFDHPGLIFSDMVLNEDTLIVIGIIVDDEPPYEQGIFFAKMDTLGGLLSLKKYFGEGDNTYGLAGFPSGLLKVTDGSGYLLLTGYFETGNGIVIKLDRNGDLLWQQEYEDNNSQQDFYKTIIEVPNGFIIGGHKYPSYNMAHLFIMKIDDDGNKEWEQVYWENTHVDNLQGMFQEEDEIIVSSYANFNPGTGVNYRVKIMAIDGYGNIEWNWESEPSLEEVRIIGLTHVEDGSWVYGSMKGQYNGIGSPFQYQQKVVIRNEFFSFVKEINFDDIDGSYDDFINMIPLADGDWLGLGGNMELVVEPNLVDSHIYSWMTRISNGLEGQPNLGDTLWTREDLAFPDTAGSLDQYLHSAVELPSGSIIAAGNFSYFFGAPMNHGLLIKVNQHGCTDPTDCIPTNLTFVKTPGKQKDQALKVYPNPVRHLLHFEHDQIGQWDEVELLDVNGAVVRKSSRNDAVLMAGLGRGVYVLRLWKDGRFWTRRVVRQ